MKTGVKIFVVMALLLGSIGTITYLNRPDNGDGELVNQVKREVHPVRVEQVVPTTLIQTLDKTGEIEPDQDVTLTAQVSGRITTIDKKLGDVCQKGDIYLQIEKINYKIALQQAKASLRQGEVAVHQTRSALNRVKTLKEGAVATAQEFEAAEAAFHGAEASLEQAKAGYQFALKNLKETSVRCPFDGKIAGTFVEDGETVGPSVPLGRVVNTETLKLTVNVSPIQLNSLRVGQMVTLFDPSMPSVKAIGKVARLGVAADPETKTFPVEILSDNPNDLLKPGQVVRATCRLTERTNVISLPRQVPMIQDEQPVVYVVEAGTAKLRKIDLGDKIGSRIIVLSGLNENEKVVIFGQDALVDGSSVDIIETIQTPPSDVKDHV